MINITNKKLYTQVAKQIAAKVPDDRKGDGNVGFPFNFLPQHMELSTNILSYQFGWYGAAYSKVTSTPFGFPESRLFLTGGMAVVAVNMSALQGDCWKSKVDFFTALTLPQVYAMADAGEAF